jgi:peptide/nickel transport system permease protein
MSSGATLSSPTVKTRRSTLAFLGRRFAGLAVVLVSVSFFVFSLLYLAPGSVEQILLGGAHTADPVTIHAVRARYHLDDPFLLQYAHWLAHAVHLDFGTSVRTNEPVLDAIGNRLALSAELAGLAFSLSIVTGVPLGILAAVRRRGPIDRAVVVSSVVGLSAPAFASAILLLYVFAVRLGWFPVFGHGSGFAGTLHHLLLPAIALALTAAGLLVKITRAAFVTQLEQDYVTFARARGVSPYRLLFAFVLRNAAAPIVTAAGLILAYMLAGSVLIEVAFALPGIGSLLVDSVVAKDVPVVQGLAMLIAAIVVLVNLAVDVLYPLIDPRIVLTKRAE